MPIAINFNKIDTEKIRVTRPTQNKSGGLNANIVYGSDEQSLIFQTPRMACPFGISTFKENGGTAKYSLDLSFRGMQENEELAKFHAFLRSVDELVMEAAVANSEQWFGRKRDRTILEELYSRSIRESQPKTDKEGRPIRYPPTFRTKIVANQGPYDTEVYTSDRKRGDVFDINKGDSVIAIVKVSTLYFMNKAAFGISYSLVQAMVFPSNRISGCIIDVEEPSGVCAIKEEEACEPDDSEPVSGADEP